MHTKQQMVEGSGAVYSAPIKTQDNSNTNQQMSEGYIKVSGAMHSVVNYIANAESHSSYCKEQGLKLVSTQTQLSFLVPTL